MKAIPKSLLIHNVMFQRIKSQDRWGEKEAYNGIVIKHVRMEPSSRIVRDKNSAEVQLSAVLFYDCRNSQPKNMEFKEDDIIVFNGQKHRVQIVEPLYDNKKLHHYELGLIKYA